MCRLPPQHRSHPGLHGERRVSVSIQSASKACGSESLVHETIPPPPPPHTHSYYAGRPSLGQYNAAKNTYEYMTYADLEAQVEQFACGLRHVLGDSSSPPMVAICAISRLEWYVADFACLFLGIPTVSHCLCS